MIDEPTPAGYGARHPRANVHFCSPDNDHRVHHTMGMGRVPGWFVLTLRGCVGAVEGPFDTEAAAHEIAATWLAQTQAKRTGRGR